MGQLVVLSGTGHRELLNEIRLSLRSTRPRIIGIASAFLSVAGVEAFRPIIQRLEIAECRLVAGTDLLITHPEALAIAQAAGWNVRIGRSEEGIFHPKLIVGGAYFNDNGGVLELNYTYLGSGNLTNPGLTKNVECGIIFWGNDCPHYFSDAFCSIYQNAVPLTPVLLHNYSSAFAARARSRDPKDFTPFGLTDSEDAARISVATIRTRRPPRLSAVSHGFATAAWAGLESFTGEYTFQVEFPRAAGEVVHRIIGTHFVGPDQILVHCVDAENRVMRYRFYEDNSMFRLNVPNEVPGVEWARQHRAGIAVVSITEGEGGPISLRILRPGDEADEIVRRSFQLGTWRTTSTRAYGWL